MFWCRNASSARYVGWP